MVVADTSRTKHYLKELIKSELLPNYVLLLMNSNNDLLPGQAEIASENELVALLKSSSIRFEIAPNGNINSDEIIKIINTTNNRVHPKITFIKGSRPHNLYKFFIARS